MKSLFRMIVTESDFRMILTESDFRTILTESDFSSHYITVCNGYLAITNSGSSQPPSWEGKQEGVGRAAAVAVMGTGLCGCP